MSNWYAYDDGRSIGNVGEADGVILADEEHADGARITLRRGREYISVSLKIYGWMDHTRFFNTDSDAQREYRTMRSAMDKVLGVIKSSDMNDIKVWEAISDFVRRFP